MAHLKMGVSRKQNTSNFSKNEYFLPPCTHTYTYSFFGKFDLSCFLETPVLRFTLFPYYRRCNGNRIFGLKINIFELFSKFVDSIILKLKLMKGIKKEVNVSVFDVQGKFILCPKSHKDLLQIFWLDLSEWQENGRRKLGKNDCFWFLMEVLITPNQLKSTLNISLHLLH